MEPLRTSWPAQSRARLAAAFQDERVFWQLCAGFFGLCAVLKGLRRPGTWALNQAQLTYSHGFIKRGLPGALYSATGFHHRRPLEVAFALELLLLFGVLAWFCHSCRLSQRLGSAAVLAVFASSYVVTYLTHLIGYADILDATLALLLLGIRSPRRRFLLGLPVFAAAMLIHENFLLLLAPLVLLIFVLDGLTASQPRQSRRAFASGLLLAGWAAGLAWLTAVKGLISQQQALAIRQEAAARIDFPLRNDLFAVLSTTLRSDLHEVNVLGLHTYRWWCDQATAVAVLLPPLLFFGYLGRGILRRARAAGTLSARQSGWLHLAIGCALAAPLALNLVGLDQVRWAVFCAFDGFLTLCLLCRAFPAQTVQEKLSPALRNAAVLLLAFNMVTGFGLFDGETVTPYPFFPRYLAQPMLRHDEPVVRRFVKSLNSDQMQ